LFPNLEYMEQFRGKSLRRRAVNGICSAIIAVNLKEENESRTIYNGFMGAPFDEYNLGAQNVLNELSDDRSEIYTAFPSLRYLLKSEVEKAKELYPNQEGLQYLIKILHVLSVGLG